jgi:(E)-4-hydroxy-3-methylbut-2-enyl-diphosphate synthase
VKLVSDACRKAGVPIRIGVNSGSLEKEILAKYGGVTPEAMVESGLYHISLLEKFDFTDIVLSLKSSDTFKMYKAYEIAAEKCKYPLHLGVTEAGTESMGVIKSAAGIGGLLLRGIGNTIRVSLTDDVCEEVKIARHILRSLGIEERRGMNIVSCPTCGRTRIDLISLVREFEERAEREGLMEKDIKVALMGCAVNGPGEAREADIGIAGGVGEALLFKKGVTVRKIRESDIISELIDEIKRM